MSAVAQVAEPLPARHESRRVVLGGIAVSAGAAMAVSAAIAISGPAEYPALVAAARALMVGVPIAVGLYAWQRDADRRLGLLLMVAGAAWFVTTFAESGDELTHTIGRIAGWLVEVLLVYLILSFPEGRLPARVDRLLVGATGLVVLVLYLPRLVLAEDFVVPSPYTSCTEGCPGNAFFTLGSEPAFVGSVMRPLGALLVFALMMAVVVRMVRRMRAATPLTRRMFGPVVAIATARAAVLGVAIVLRDLDTRWPIQGAAWLLAFAVPAIAIAFLVGIMRWRLFAGKALQRLAQSVGTLPDAATLRRAFAEAFDDPSIEIVFPAPGADVGWMDSRGRAVALPGADTGRSLSEVRHDGIVVAAIVHDAGLRARPDLVDAGVSMAAVVLDNQRLTAEAQASLRELRGSRARIAAGAERERRRLERDLHDGAQQRLVALRIELELAEELVRQDPERMVARLRELERDVDEALEELRALAHGVYPPLLADRGLGEALAGVAARSTIAVELDARGVGRYPPEVESAVYYCVTEALQNVHKHARSAHRIVVRLDGDRTGELRFSVRDDGPGTSELRAGAGMTNMRDRLAAVGGDVWFTSTPGVGTVVGARVPIAGDPAVSGRQPVRERP
jgi:signal transduction histidine kinase